MNNCYPICARGNVVDIFKDERDSNSIIHTIPMENLSEEMRDSFSRVPKKKCIYVPGQEPQIFRYGSFHCHTDGSVFDGGISAKKLAQLAPDFCAITDHGSMTSTFEFYQAMRALGKHPVIGMEGYTENLTNGEKNCNHLILLCKNEVGYHNLLEIVSDAEANFYRKPQINLESLTNHHEGLICLSACLGGEIPQAIMDGDYAHAEEVIQILQDLFGDDFYLEVQRHNISGETLVNTKLEKYAYEYGIKMVATTDSHYAQESDREAHDMLLAIGTHRTISDPKRFRMEGENYHVLSTLEMEELWEDKPIVWDGMFSIMEKIDFEFVTGKLFMPEFECPDGLSQDSYFSELARKGFDEKYAFLDPKDIPSYRERLEYEISTILSMGFPGYFLVVQDYVNYARSIGGFVGPGRGSAVGSMCSYCLGITSLEPVQYGLLFERFLNPERVSMPDVDMDFDVEVRDKVMQYVRKKYGTECVSKIITFGTFSARSVVRDVGRVLEVELKKIDKFSKAIPAKVKMTLKKALDSSAEFKKMYDEDPELKRVYEIASKLEGLKRHRSTHACGVVIGSQAINKFVPEIMIKDKHSKTGEKARTTSFTGPELEDLGLLKMDFLGLRNMSVIKEVVDLVPSLPRNGEVPIDDPYIYELLGSGRSVGIFQVESGGMQKLMRQMFYDVSKRISEIEKRYKIKGYGIRMSGNPDPEDRKNYNSEMTRIGVEMFERLIAAISLYRPGPMDYIPQYIEGMMNPSSIHYDTPMLEPILNKTYGVLVYQEQVQQVCRELAGYSLGRADIIRRAMGKKKLEIMLAEQQTFLYGNAKTMKKGETLVPGCIANGVTEAAANVIWDKMVEFANYAFNKSHSAGYADISATTGYLKLYYPVEFEVATLNSFVGKPKKIQEHLAECKRLGIKILGPDVNNSSSIFSIEDGKIRVGLTALKNLGKTANEILSRRNRVWNSLEEFLHDVSDVIDKRSFEALSLAGALDSFGYKRKELSEKAESISGYLQKTRKFMELSDGIPNIPVLDTIYSNLIKVNIEKYTEEFDDTELYSKEFDYCGMYISGHPLDGLAEYFIGKDIVGLGDIVPDKDEDLSLMSDEEVGDDEDTKIVISPYNGMVVNVIGICREAIQRVTKAGKLMYSLKIVDITGEIDVTVWPDKVESIITNVSPSFFRDIVEQPVIINGKVISDSYGSKISSYSLSLVDKNAKDGCAAVFVNAPDTAAYNHLKELLSGFGESEKKGTQVIAYYDLKKRNKAICISQQTLTLANFLRLKSDFKVISLPKQVEVEVESKEKSVNGEWLNLVK